MTSRIDLQDALTYLTLLDDATSQHMYIHGHTARLEIGHKATNVVKVPRRGHEKDIGVCGTTAPLLATT
jgi:hypothetical protein